MKNKIRKPSRRLLAEAAYTGGRLGLDVTVTPIALGQWVIDVRGSGKGGLPIATYLTGRENVALAYLDGLLAGAELQEG